MDLSVEMKKKTTPLPATLPAAALRSSSLRSVSLRSAAGKVGAVHRRPGDGLNSFQIQFAAVALSGENHRQQMIHFLADCPLDLLGRFSSSGDKVSSSGRSWQIFSLTSSNWRLSSRKR